MAATLLVTDPSVDGPQFEFGLAIDGVAAYYPTVANVPGPLSKWHVAEWDTPQTLDPTTMTEGDMSQSDPILGKPSYSWTTRSGDIGLSAYGAPGAYLYRLSDYNGRLAPSGGQNILLEADVPAGPSNSFDHPIVLDADEALTNTKSGGVAQQVGNFFTVTFNAPGSAHYDASKPVIPGFLQVPLSDSRGNPPPFASFYDGSFVYNVTNVESLPFASGSHLSHVTIDLNAALEQMLKANLQDYTSQGVTPLPTGFTNLSNWTLGSVFIGDETTDGGGLSLDVGNIRLTADASQTYTNPQGPTVSITDATKDLRAAPQTNVVLTFDSATNRSGVEVAAAYTGPADYLKHQYIWAGQDGVSMATNANDIFILGGPSSDAIAVSGGNNVLNGGGGSNFLVGATGSDGGHDVFFVDPAGASPTWSTIVNFHPGDMLTLWGFDPAASIYTWDFGTGAAGSTGATLRSVLAPGAAMTCLTFSGLSPDDVSSKLSFTSGQVKAGSYLLMQER